MTPLLSPGLRAPALLGGGSGRPVPVPVVAASPSATLTVDGFDLPDLGPCRHQPVLLVLLFDNSPSVVGDHDPLGTRFEEAGVALDAYRRRCGCLRELVAIRTFDRATSSDVGPVPMDTAGWPQVVAALTTPPELDRGWSLMRPALRDAERLASRHPHHRPELVVFSDFRLFDWFPGLVLDRLGRFPGRAHAIVLSAEPPVRLLANPVTVRRITTGSPRGDVAHAVVGALSDVPPAELVR